jgi:molybdopterin/thiamine biosynthesis adenylyltransferase
MNMGVLCGTDLNKIHQVKVIIVGLGGLGGYFVNHLIRLGVLNMTLVDFDYFSESDLNRQLFSNTHNIGNYKVDVIAKELELINPEVSIKRIKKRVQETDHISGDFIIDCTDNKETKIYLSKLSSKLNIPLLHGACGGWYGQVGWISPSCNLIEELYGDDESGLEKILLNPPFIVNAVASIMTSEFVKMIKEDSHLVLDELLLIDLLNNVIIKSGGSKHD